MEQLNIKPLKPHKMQCNDPRKKGNRKMLPINDKHCTRMSKSLCLNRAAAPSVNNLSHVNHMSLFDESDEILAFERWRNAGLALRRVLTGKHKSKNAERESLEGERNAQCFDSEIISPVCQTVVNEILKDNTDDDDDLLPIDSSPNVRSNGARGTHLQPGSRNELVFKKRDRCGGIWDSQLYPTGLPVQVDISPQPKKVQTSEGRNGLFSWQEQVSSNGSCLLPQAVSRKPDENGKLDNFTSCNDQNVCNNYSNICDNNRYSDAFKCNAKSENTSKELNSFDNHRAITLKGNKEEKDAYNLCRQFVSSLHSDEEVDQVACQPRNNQDGDSDVTDYSSMCDCSGDIYFHGDTDKNEALSPSDRTLHNVTSTFKETMLRDRKKKKNLARRSLRTKKSSSSSEVCVEENSAYAKDPNLGYDRVYESYPSLYAYNQENITPPRRSSIARHFHNRNSGDLRDDSFLLRNDLFNNRADATLPSLPTFDLPPLDRIPSFLASANNCSPGGLPDYDPIDLWTGITRDGEADDSNVILNSSAECRKSDLSDENHTRSLKDGSCPGDSGQNCADLKNAVSVSSPDKAGSSLLSPDSWIRLIDEIYQPIIDAGEESALSDIEASKPDDRVSGFFRCLDTSDKSSDSGDADDEFECECEHCQLLRNFDQPLTSTTEPTANGNVGAEETPENNSSVRNDPWDLVWLPNDGDMEFTLNELRPMEQFFWSFQDLSQDPVELMFQNVITQMLAVHPDLLGDQAPPPVRQSVIDSLPRFTATNENRSEDLTCSVCLCPFEVGEDVTRLPCQHLYHPLCIQAWLAKSGTCPVCRHSLHRTQMEGTSEIQGSNQGQRSSVDGGHIEDLNVMPDQTVQSDTCSAGRNSLHDSLNEHNLTPEFQGHIENVLRDQPVAASSSGLTHNLAHGSVECHLDVEVQHETSR